MNPKIKRRKVFPHLPPWPMFPHGPEIINPERGMYHITLQTYEKKIDVLPVQAG